MNDPSSPSDSSNSERSESAASPEDASSPGMDASTLAALTVAVGGALILLFPSPAAQLVVALVVVAILVRLAVRIVTRAIEQSRQETLERIEASQAARSAASEAPLRALGTTLSEVEARVGAIGEGIEDRGRTAARTAKRIKELTSLLKDQKKVIDRIQRDLDFEAAVERSRLRELPIASIFESIEDVQLPLGAINDETGHANHAEFLYVVAVARYRGARRIFEFGTCLGRTTFHLALASPDCRVFSLDLPDDRGSYAGSETGAYFRGKPEAERITLLRCDSREFDIAPYRGSMDFIWVDGDHSYEMVKNDTEKAFELLAPGGAILWHDFAPKKVGLVRYFEELTQTRPLFRIKGTSVLLHIDGVDPMTFRPHELRVSKQKIAEALARERDGAPWR